MKNVITVKFFKSNIILLYTIIYIIILFFYTIILNGNRCKICTIDDAVFVNPKDFSKDEYEQLCPVLVLVLINSDGNNLFYFEFYIVYLMIIVIHLKKQFHYYKALSGEM